MINKVDVKIFNNDGTIPKYQSSLASGLDLHCSSKDDITLQPLGQKLFPTGIHIQLPSGYEGQIRPRSGLAAKYGITIVNSPGTIDADYTGEIKIILFNMGRDPFTVKQGDRIAQLVICPIVQANFVVVDSTGDFDNTLRGANGFGSTNV